jgi:hypothetical protein
MQTLNLLISEKMKEAGKATLAQEVDGPDGCRY